MFKVRDDAVDQTVRNLLMDLDKYSPSLLLIEKARAKNNIYMGVGEKYW